LHFQVTGRNANRAWDTPQGEGFFSLDAEWRIQSTSTIRSPIAPAFDGI